MADVLIVSTIVAFIVVCVVYVEWCDRILRRDEEAVSLSTTPSGVAADRDRTVVS